MRPRPAAERLTRLQHGGHEPRYLRTITIKPRKVGSGHRGPCSRLAFGSADSFRLRASRSMLRNCPTRSASYGNAMPCSALSSSNSICRISGGGYAVHFSQILFRFASRNDRSNYLATETVTWISDVPVIRTIVPVT